MKKFLKTVLFLCAISSLAYAEETAPVVAEANAGMNAEEQKEAMDILDRMREKIEKEEAEKARLAKEARELGVQTSDVTNVEEVEAMVQAKKVEEEKPKTEAEIAGYYEIMGEEKTRPSIMDEQTTPQAETQATEVEAQ